MKLVDVDKLDQNLIKLDKKYSDQGYLETNVHTKTMYNSFVIIANDIRKAVIESATVVITTHTP